jgi:hypothetical protein
VLLVAESEPAGHFEQELRGLEQTSPAVAQYVRCKRTPDGKGASIEAGTTTPLVLAQLQLPQLGAQELEQPFGFFGDAPVRVRFGDKAFDFYEYELKLADAAHGCHLQVRTFDDTRFAGTLACHGLAPTAGSLDAAAPGGAASSSASATLDFDCPFQLLSAPGAGGSGGTSGGGTAGAGGTFSSGGKAGSGGSETGGSGGTEPAHKQCTGVNTPCSLRSSLTCEEGSGCTLDEHCGGVPPSCYGQFNVYSCTAIEGCFWASSSKTCTGSAASCSSYVGPASCGGQQGCDWRSDCKGTAPLCSELPEALCEHEPGCYLL